MSAPLANIRVADFTELLPGPFMTQALVELGADVVKIERPPHGDPVRRGSPGLFGTVNRGKRSVMLDLKSREGLAEGLRLAEAVDIVVEGYRPGVMARLGLGYDAVRERNPTIIYLSLTGYGQEGPMRFVPGHDVNYLASAGVTSLCGEPDAPPRHGIGLPIADLGGSMYALSALMAALFQRERTGRGQHLDVSMTDCAAHWLNARKGVFHHNGTNGLRAQRRAALTRPAYGVFDCRDGSVTIAALEAHFWKSLVKTLKLERFGGPEYDALPARIRDCGPINAAVAEAIAGMSRAQAVELLLEADVPVAPVLSPAEADTSPHFAARGLARETCIGPLTPFPVRLEGMGDFPEEIPELNDGAGGVA
ncbi:MAG: CaiB/BaiF CoA transferase family protein [Salinarimonas sp.]